MRIRISSYRLTPGKREDPSARMLEIGPITIWFSYMTPIAFQVEGRSRVVCQNRWTATTGKHLKAIDGGNKKDRIPGAEFEKQLNVACERFFFPRDLDRDCPAGVVADWLEDRGLRAAAAAVRRKEKE